MGFPSTAAHTNYLVGGPSSHYQDMQPYKFGASSSSYIYPTLSYNNAHQYSPGMTRQAQTLRDATSWWEEPNGMPRMTLPTMYAPASWASAGASASTYHYPHCQPSYQHHLAPPLRSIHNTRCAQVPSSPLEPASPMSSNASSSAESSPQPQFVHVVCNAPLVAPVPLPYHSPRFLQFDLPDDDEDLSHPPYCSRPHKRKRGDDDEEEVGDSIESVAVKRRLSDDRQMHWSTGTNVPRLNVRVSTASHHATLPSIGRYGHR